MLVNKWLNFGLSAVIALSGAAGAFDWSSILSAKTAASITGIAGVVKMVLNSLEPGAGQTATPTSSSVITHN